MSDIRDYACIEDGKVVMVVRWDGETDWPPAKKYKMVDLTDHPGVGSGFTYKPKAKNKFVDERPVEDVDDVDA